MLLVAVRLNVCASDIFVSAEPVSIEYEESNHCCAYTEFIMAITAEYNRIGRNGVGRLLLVSKQCLVNYRRTNHSCIHTQHIAW